MGREHTDPGPGNTPAGLIYNRPRHNTRLFQHEGNFMVNSKLGYVIPGERQALLSGNDPGCNSVRNIDVQDVNATLIHICCLVNQFSYYLPSRIIVEVFISRNFGTGDQAPGDLNTPLRYWHNHAIDTGADWSGLTSYGYDQHASYRLMTPGDARAADMVTRGPDGYLSNHGEDGHNVLHWDGHVSFADTVYASSDPTDNIFNYADALAEGGPLVTTGNGSAWAWDGSSADDSRLNIRQVEMDAAIHRTHFEIHNFAQYTATP